LDKQVEMFDKYDYVSVSLSKAEVEYIVNLLHEHTEPTHEEVMDYCKARHLNLITNSLLSELISRK
jgi:hypothetical protein